MRYAVGLFQRCRVVFVASMEHIFFVYVHSCSKKKAAICTYAIISICHLHSGLRADHTTDEDLHTRATDVHELENRESGIKR